MEISKNISFKVDYLGALASFLCLIHCMATPLIFVAKACSLTCCEEAPVWWKAIDYLFLVISFFAILFAARESSKQWVKYSLGFTWSLLLVTIINETVGVIKMPEHLIYLPALLLVGLHLYNQKYCKCGTCCSDE